MEVREKENSPKLDISGYSTLKRNERVELRRGSAAKMIKGERNASNRRNIRTGGFTKL